MYLWLSGAVCSGDLVAEDESGDSGDEFSHKDQTQEYSVLQKKRQG